MRVCMRAHLSGGPRKARPQLRSDIVDVGVCQPHILECLDVVVALWPRIRVLVSQTTPARHVVVVEDLLERQPCRCSRCLHETRCREKAGQKAMQHRVEGRLRSLARVDDAVIGGARRATRGVREPAGHEYQFVAIVCSDRLRYTLQVQPTGARHGNLYGFPYSTRTVCSSRR